MCQSVLELVGERVQVWQRQQTLPAADGLVGSARVPRAEPVALVLELSMKLEQELVQLLLLSPLRFP